MRPTLNFSTDNNSKYIYIDKEMTDGELTEIEDGNMNSDENTQLLLSHNLSELRTEQLEASEEAEKYRRRADHQSTKARTPTYESAIKHFEKAIELQKAVIEKITDRSPDYQREMKLLAKTYYN